MKWIFALLVFFAPALAHAGCSSFSTTSTLNFPILLGFNYSASAYQPVSINSDCSLATTGTTPTSPSYSKPSIAGNTETDTAGTTSATPSTVTTALASSTSRMGCQIINSGTAVIDVGTASTPIIPLSPGGAPYNCISQQQINVSSATASVSYVVVSW